MGSNFILYPCDFDYRTFTLSGNSTHVGIVGPMIYYSKGASLKFNSISGIVN
jgi:hypothetical protein